LLSGHSDIILTIDVLDNYIYSAGKDTVIKVWRLEAERKFRMLASLKGHADVINSISISPRTGSLLVSCSSDKNIKIW